MHGNIFNIVNTSRNIAPQVFPYKVKNSKDNSNLIPKYFNINSFYSVPTEANVCFLITLLLLHILYLYILFMAQQHYL